MADVQTPPGSSKGLPDESSPRVREGEGALSLAEVFNRAEHVVARAGGGANVHGNTVGTSEELRTGGRSRSGREEPGNRDKSHDGDRMSKDRGGSEDQSQAILGLSDRSPQDLVTERTRKRRRTESMDASAMGDTATKGTNVKTGGRKTSKGWEDPVTAGLVPEDDVEELFEWSANVCLFDQFFLSRSC